MTTMTLGQTLGLPDDHVPYACPGEHENPGCMFCDGGLTACGTCGGLEGGMPTQCPGRAMTGDEADAVYAGALDFRAGEWVRTHSRYAPGWTQTDEGRKVYAEAEVTGRG